jgi:hypothetical protein
MTTPPSYSFFPWVRHGLGNQITSSDLDTTVKLRATIPVDLEVRGTGLGNPVSATVTRTIPLAGPGDIIGIDRRAIVRTEPCDWITNFEPNYVPFIEFYDEDFPWRYTPAKPDATAHRLRPWVALVVLEESEFGDGVKGERPCQFIVVANANVLPPATQLWAWAHVHANRGMMETGLRLPSLAGAGAVGPAVQRLGDTLNENADLAYSRVLCPRKLKDNTGYHAFLVPVFESGRLAGLGLDPAEAPNATASAWGTYANRKEGSSLPYYHRWYFKTGSVGDFEYLVRLLKRTGANARVGMRDMDVRHPGANLPGITDPALAGVLRLGGALQVPRSAYTPAQLAEVDRYENWAKPYPTLFQRKLAALLNLADDSAAAASASTPVTPTTPAGAGDDDPVITPPLYGRWHALAERLLFRRDGGALSPNDNWVHQLNLDPRHRVTAGFGTRVVQQKQEELMDAAWRQVGKVLEAQRRIRAAQLVQQIVWVWHTTHLLPLHEKNPERAFTLAAPVHGRVLDAAPPSAAGAGVGTAGPTTIAYQVQRSALPRAMLSAPVRRVLRPRARLQRFLPTQQPGEPQALLRRINAGEVSPAPARQKPDLVTPADVARRLRQDVPAFLVSALRRWRWLAWAVLLAALIVALLLWLLTRSSAAVAAALAVGSAIFALLRRWTGAVARSDVIDDAVAHAADVDAMPRSPGFGIAEPGQDPAPATGSTDSVDAQRFKTGVRQARALIEATRAAASKSAEREGPHAPLSFASVAAAVVAGIDPHVTIPRRTLAGLTLPARLEPLVTEEFLEPFAYPVFDLPMYRPLLDISAELFLPNLNLIEPNSVTLLETNQPFIEAYMVGLNHEFARELLWREYPTDQRGSYFRQFWDVSAYLDPAPSAGADAQREKLRDIPPLHRWSRSSRLGDHDNREVAGSRENEAVLTIRGELLKKYPNAVIYAHRARWQRKQDGGIDVTKERQLEPFTATEEGQPPRAKVRLPLYDAKADPDIYFFGFDLTVEAARGGTGEQPGDDPGWFFVIKERPGEPRFGLDISRSDALQVWNDLSWDDVLPGGAAGSYVDVGPGMTSLQLSPPTAPADQEKAEQHADDVAIAWNASMNAADIAYVMYQAPVLVAIHAAELLRG